MTDAALLMFIVSVFILLAAIFLFLAIVLFDKRLFAKSSRSWTVGTSQLDKEVFVVNKKFALAAITMLMAVSLAACGGGDKDAGASNNEGSAPAASSGDVQAVTLKAKNFEFDQTEIRVKKGQTVKLTFENEQGIHGVEIPDLNVKLDQPGTTEFVADKEGTYEFKCSIMCGSGHNDMVGKIIVE